MSKKKIMFTGGGTVGHVTLNLLLIPLFLEDGWEVHYIGDKHGIEREEIENSHLAVTFHSIATGKLRRYFSLQNVADLFKVALGIVQSFAIMLKVRPKVLFSKGGFVSVPPVIAARLSKVTVLVHESDSSIGLANRIAYRFATLMYTTFEQNGKLIKEKHIGAVTKIGQPFSGDSSDIENIKQFFDPNYPTLLFIGGSGGARVFNDFITENREKLLAQYNIINISGDKSLNELSSHLYRVHYVSDLYQPLMDLADVVVTRGGSNTLFELLAMAKPHLIVPLGRASSRGDQVENADYFEGKGYASQIPETELNLPTFENKITELLDNRDRFVEKMRSSNEIKSLNEFYTILKEDITKHTK